MNEAKPKPRRKPAAKAAGSATQKPAPAAANAAEPTAAPVEQTAASVSLPVPHDDPTVKRVAGLNRETGWLLVTAGVVGVILPGVLGTPLLVLGAAVLWPGSGDRMERWLEKRSPTLFRKSLKQVDRFLDDLERRYPKR